MAEDSANPKNNNGEEDKKNAPFNPFEDGHFAAFPDSGDENIDDPEDLEPSEEGDLPQNLDYSAENESPVKEKVVEENADFTVVEDNSAGKDRVIEAEPVDAEIISGSVKSENNDSSVENLNADEKEGGLKEELMEMLEQAGISVGTLVKSCISIVVLVLVILFFALGWYKVFDFGDDSNEDQQQMEEEQQDEESKQPEQDTEAVVNPFLSALTNYILGTEFVGGGEDLATVVFSSTRASYVIGLISVNVDSLLPQYTETIRRLQNLYFTDVYELLNLSIDRRSTLAAHINEMQQLIDKSKESIQEIDNDLTELENEFNRAKSQQNEAENLYFQNINDLQGGLAAEYLSDFKMHGKEAFVLKADFNALTTVRGLFIATLSAVEPRLTDIRVNTEALIQGIRVFDIPQSDIRAIIPVSNL